MRWLALTLIALQAATCGQSGRLTLPEDAAARPVMAPIAVVAMAAAVTMTAAVTMADAVTKTDAAPRQALR